MPGPARSHKQAGGASGDVGEVDRLRLGTKRPLDRMKGEQIVDQGEQVAAAEAMFRHAGIIAAQRTLALGRIAWLVDDVASRAAQRLSSRSPKERRRRRRPARRRAASHRPWRARKTASGRSRRSGHAER